MRPVEICTRGRMELSSGRWSTSGVDGRKLHSAREPSSLSHTGSFILATFTRLWTGRGFTVSGPREREGERERGRENDGINGCEERVDGRRSMASAVGTGSSARIVDFIGQDQCAPSSFVSINQRLPQRLSRTIVAAYAIVPIEAHLCSPSYSLGSSISFFSDFLLVLFSLRISSSPRNRQNENLLR